MNERPGPHFLKAKFTCNHCGELPYDPPKMLLDILEDLRDEFDSPVIINSEYRCPTHNRNVGGVKNSRHLVGDAADVVVKGGDPHDVYVFLDERVGSDSIKRFTLASKPPPIYNTSLLLREDDLSVTLTKVTINKIRKLTSISYDYLGKP
ncbi:D-Ala-D-Ala carboxypeptidase family metallohydrolase [Marinobacterium rhizophilum]|uniref:D-Ala-D-Ala carboxypeptidase family metallohydrolase n=1 Tax=Marinobacterium rhizophilum TaxID=420402 RepID=UPI0009FF8B9D|nr:D-Ala-D-Ala carboxypeptidase family metallohydrolase [Marinobacterium rhizophilum]